MASSRWPSFGLLDFVYRHVNAFVAAVDGLQHGEGVNGFVLGEGSWIKGKDLDYNCWIALFDG